MFSRIFKISAIFAFVLIAGQAAFAQVDASNSPMMPEPIERRGMEPLSYEAMLEKQKMKRRKKQHEEMLERGETLLKLSEDLQVSFEKHHKLNSADHAKLKELEKNLVKIRKELGGDDVDDEPDPKDANKPISLGTALKTLREKTVSLVDELKKTTRFSISAVAIQSSNSLLKMVRFLRLKK